MSRRLRPLLRRQPLQHQALRALNDVAVHGADVSEVLETTKHIRAGDAQAWYDAWTALGDRNLARARAKVYDRASGGGEHSQLGASSLWQADFFDWMEEKFGP